MSKAAILLRSLGPPTEEVFEISEPLKLHGGSVWESNPLLTQLGDPILLRDIVHALLIERGPDEVCGQIL
jgi:hypothetical protein